MGWVQNSSCAKYERPDNKRANYVSEDSAIHMSMVANLLSRGLVKVAYKSWRHCPLLRCVPDTVRHDLPGKSRWRSEWEGVRLPRAAGSWRGCVAPCKGYAPFRGIASAPVKGWWAQSNAILTEPTR